MNHLLNKYKQKLYYDKRESLNEYVKTIIILQFNLNQTKYTPINLFSSEIGINVLNYF